MTVSGRIRRTIASGAVATMALLTVASVAPSSAVATPRSGSTAGPAGELYLPEVDANDIAVVDTADGRITARIPVSGGASRPAVMAATPDGSKLYVDDFGLAPATITVIDRTHDTVKTVHVGSTPLGAFTSVDGRELYLPEVGGTVEIVSTRSDLIVRRLHFADIPAAAMQGPDGNLYVSFASGLIGVYNPVTGAVVHAPIWSGGVGTFWFSFTRDGAKLYTDTVNTLGVIDVAHWRLVKTVSTGAARTYHASDPLAFVSTLSPDGTKLYVTVFGDTGVKILDTATDRFVDTIRTSGYVTGVTFSADGSRGYISDLGPTSTLLPGPIGGIAMFGNVITLGLLGPGQLITFDPATDEPVGAPLPTRAGPGISAWVPSP